MKKHLSFKKVLMICICASLSFCLQTNTAKAHATHSSETTELACFPDLPKPEVVITSIEYLDGLNFTRFYFSVTNWMDYPDEIFDVIEPNQPCGSRAEVNIQETDGTHIYGFCVLSNPSDMADGLWFGFSGQCQIPITEVRFEIWDEVCDIRYTSDPVSINVCPEPDAHNFNELIDDCLCETCDDGIQNGDEEGVDCGGQLCEPCISCDDGIMNGSETGVDCGGTDCLPCAPDVACLNANIYVDFHNPDFQPSFYKRIWVKNAGAFVDMQNSTFDFESEIKIKRQQNYINIDWTTQGAGIDGIPNGTINNKDKGKLYRSCLPLAYTDIWRFRKYRIKATNPGGTDFCNGELRVLMLPTGTTEDPIWECTGNPVFLPDFVVSDTTSGYAAPAVHFSEIAHTTSAQTLINEANEDEINSRSSEKSFVGEPHIFPNPGTSELTLEWTNNHDEAVQIRIFDMVGQSHIRNAFEAKKGYNKVILDTHSLAEGMYVVHLESKDQRQTMLWTKTIK